MKTSKEMQLKILDKMRENVEGSNWLFDGIQYSSSSLGWIDKENSILDFMGIEYRIKPLTITINGVEIPKPLNELDRYGYGKLYEPCSNNEMYRIVFKVNYSYYNCRSLLYSSASEAIEASKLLFGIK